MQFEPMVEHPAVDPFDLGGVLDVLDRLGQNLRESEDGAEQIRIALEACRDALRADAVFWYSAADGVAGPIVATIGVPAARLAEMARAMLDQTPGAGGHIVRSSVEVPLTPAVTARSVVMARVSRSRGLWIVAVHTDDGRHFSANDARILTVARRMLVNQRDQTQANERLRDALFGLVRSLTAAIEAKDRYTWGHSERVARIAVLLGSAMGLGEETGRDLYLAGLLHDIGKIGVRDEVLRKPDQLTGEEFDHVITHTILGDHIISAIPQFHHVRPGVRNHHERYDGNGYPDGLRGNGIPLLARVLAVADSCDAMMSARPYRAPLSPECIEHIFEEGAGSQWDPVVVRAFLSCRADAFGIFERGIGDSVLRAVERAVQAQSIHSCRRSITPADATRLRSGKPIT